VSLRSRFPYKAITLDSTPIGVPVEAIAISRDTVIRAQMINTLQVKEAGRETWSPRGRLRVDHRWVAGHVFVLPYMDVQPSILLP